MNGLASQVLGVFAVAILAAATVYAASHAARRLGHPLPRWIMPFAIVTAIAVFTVWNDYNWFPRLRAQLPASVEVLGQGTGLKAMRPWTVIVPVTTRFTAIDRAAISRTGDLARGTILLVERGQRTRTVTMEFDCASLRERPVASNGVAADWIAVRPGDAAYRIACNAGG